MFQPFADALKLLRKQRILPWRGNSYLFFISPLLSLFLVLLLWCLIPVSSSRLTWNLRFFVLLILMGLNLYPLLLAGWRSNSQYRILGAIRGVAQTVSYEISLALILLGFLVLMGLFTMERWFLKWRAITSLISLPLVLMWILTCVAETNRTPFDFAEGESELVSGFNIEYGSFGFTLLFLREYAIILFLSLLRGLLLFSPKEFNILGALVMLTLAAFWVWLRVTLPRHRYDLLISLAWTVLLPLSLTNLFYFLVFCAS